MKYEYIKSVKFLLVIAILVVSISCKKQTQACYKCDVETIGNVEFCLEPGDELPKWGRSDGNGYLKADCKKR